MIDMVMVRDKNFGIFRRKIGEKSFFRSSSKRKSHGKFVWKKNRTKIGFIGDFSAKNRKSPIFLWKNRTSAARAGRRVDEAKMRRFFGEKLILSPIYRRFIGRFFGKIQENPGQSDCLLLLIQRSRFVPRFF